MQRTQICRILAKTHCILCFQSVQSRQAVKLSNTNGNYAHKAFIETEFSSGKTAENTWLVFQGYYEDEPAKIYGADNSSTEVAARKGFADSLEFFLLGKSASDILNCDKHLSGVTLSISFRRSPNDFTVISESIQSKNC